MCAVKKTCRFDELAKLNQPPRFRGGTAGQTAWSVKRLGFYGKATTSAKLPQGNYVALAPASTSKVLTYDQHFHSEPPNKIVGHELFKGLVSPSLIEWQDAAVINGAGTS
jgi:hypothetical protein